MLEGGVRYFLHERGLSEGEGHIHPARTRLYGLKHSSRYDIRKLEYWIVYLAYNWKKRRIDSIYRWKKFSNLSLMRIIPVHWGGGLRERIFFRCGLALRVVACLWSKEVFPSQLTNVWPLLHFHVNPSQPYLTLLNHFKKRITIPPSDTMEANPIRKS